MKVYVSIVAETGEITGFYALSSADDVQQNAPSGEAIIEADTALFGNDLNSDLFWYDAGAFAQRPTLMAPSYTIAADGLDSVEVELPLGTIVRYAHQDRTISLPADQDFEFTSAVPGRFEVRITPPFPYQRQTVEITAE